MGLGPAEPVHADAQQPVPYRTAVEVGVEARHRDAVEIDVGERLVIREIGEMRDLADFHLLRRIGLSRAGLCISHGHTRSNDRACPWLRIRSALRPFPLQVPFRIAPVALQTGGPPQGPGPALGVHYTPKKTSASA
ncbi:hypothetical protein GCM10009830_14110 [Glycomyces endophyticus]|uniref:Uncharacterized protein n=2 Tax=Glycomyces endophyticus TaxID=480996 RepID=A0ABP4SGM0_9ACTN